MQKMLNIFKPSFRRTVVIAIAYSLEGTNGGTDMIIECHQRARRFLLFSAPAQSKPRVILKRRGNSKARQKAQTKSWQLEDPQPRGRKMTNPATKQMLMEKRMRMKTPLRTRIRRRNHVSPKFIQIWTSLLPICHVRVMVMKIDSSISFVLQNAAGTQVFYVNLWLSM